MTSVASLRTVAFGLVLLTTFFVTIPVAGQEGASLAVEIINGTAGGQVPVDIEVTLQAFQDDQEVGRWTAVVGPEGLARFAGLDPKPELTYVASSAYRGVRYFSDPLSLLTPSLDTVPLTVYEITDDASVVRLLADSTVILGVEGDDGTLRMLEVLSYENTSDQTFQGRDVAGGRVTVDVPLPPQAFDVEAMHAPGSLAVLGDRGGVADTAPLLPGVRDLILSYRVAYTGDSYTWVKTYSYPTAAVRLLAAQGIELATSSGWETMGGTELNGAVYTGYQTSAASSGGRLQARIISLPLSAGERSRRLTQNLRTVGMAVAIGGGIVAGAYGVDWRRRRRAEREVERARLGRRQELLERIASLDREFQAGEREEADYRARRDMERGALRRLMEEERR